LRAVLKVPSHHQFSEFDKIVKPIKLVNKRNLSRQSNLQEIAAMSWSLCNVEANIFDRPKLIELGKLE
jgi:hypothetical protein